MQPRSIFMWLQTVGVYAVQVKELISDTHRYSRCSGWKSRSEALYMQRPAS